MCLWEAMSSGSSFSSNLTNVFCECIFGWDLHLKLVKQIALLNVSGLHPSFSRTKDKPPSSKKDSPAVGLWTLPSTLALYWNVFRLRTVILSWVYSLSASPIRFWTCQATTTLWVNSLKKISFYIHILRLLFLWRTLTNIHSGNLKCIHSSNFLNNPMILENNILRRILFHRQGNEA